MTKKSTSLQAPETNGLRHSSTKVDTTPYHAKDNRLETVKKSEKRDVLSPILYNRYAEVCMLLLSGFVRFGKFCGGVSSGRAEIYMLWLAIASFGYCGATVNRLVATLGMYYGSNSVRVMKYRLTLLIKSNLISLSSVGRYGTYRITRYAEKNILNFEMSKRDIISFVKQFREVQKQK